MTMTREENARSEMEREALMKRFVVQYTATDITREEVIIEAESAEEAQRIVEEYEFDNSDSRQVECFEFSVSDVELRGSVP